MEHCSAISWARRHPDLSAAIGLMLAALVLMSPYLCIPPSTFGAVTNVNDTTTTSCWKPAYGYLQMREVVRLLRPNGFQ